ncbi:hypothetical protein H2O64_14780 [Kordia sp. YSTF-M3]|uniref:Response regulator n=1 Tax=Kordia aestuariivivens TaxID=2759037 RepID=A0ABR7QBJ1_9FLAO|nr:hypothetical protein [Kordia aestuariivivens]MBC8755941.1 hypothetical protein [Kordia aestuariivivens]
MSKIEVLIITKRNATFEYIKEALTDYNLEFHESRSYPKALSIITQEKIDLFMVDLSFREESRKVEFIKSLSRYTPLSVTFIFLAQNDTDTQTIKDVGIPQPYETVVAPIDNGGFMYTMKLVLERYNSK